MLIEYTIDEDDEGQNYNNRNNTTIYNIIAIIILYFRGHSVAHTEFNNEIMKILPVNPLLESMRSPIGPKPINSNGIYIV